MKSITYLTFFGLIILFSCKKNSLTISGSFIPRQKIEDSVLISIDDKFHFNQIFGYYFIDRRISINLKGDENSFINVNYPKIGYSKILQVKGVGDKHLELHFFFDDSLINKYIFFDTIMKYEPEKLQFEAILNE